jgi:hypothetical protein
MTKRMSSFSGLLNTFATLTRKLASDQAQSLEKLTSGSQILATVADWRFSGFNNENGGWRRGVERPSREFLCTEHWFRVTK